MHRGMAKNIGRLNDWMIRRIANKKNYVLNKKIHYYNNKLIETMLTLGVNMGLTFGQ